ncbi:hypothetical protein [Halobellus ruber]|uniref:Uncharacterized protein n=1 Tax=Halobellus ruber TaxID=2761102 RepID=A0A7J9SFF0_9EURY|nr:hypothetical protein [Halobellus ruber]MBB6644726.1 hypothetical protein [Halobellus ruber]
MSTLQTASDTFGTTLDELGTDEIRHLLVDWMRIKVEKDWTWSYRDPSASHRIINTDVNGR